MAKSRIRDFEVGNLCKNITFSGHYANFLGTWGDRRTLVDLNVSWDLKVKYYEKRLDILYPLSSVDTQTHKLNSEEVSTTLFFGLLFSIY